MNFKYQNSISNIRNSSYILIFDIHFLILDIHFRVLKTNEFLILTNTNFVHFGLPYATAVWSSIFVKSVCYFAGYIPSRFVYEGFVIRSGQISFYSFCISNILHSVVSFLFLFWFCTWKFARRAMQCMDQNPRNTKWKLESLSDSTWFIHQQLEIACTSYQKTDNCSVLPTVVILLRISGY